VMLMIGAGAALTSLIKRWKSTRSESGN
jgi:hypothetical protein